ncbi:MAG: glycoside hydrolase family 9 protein, partial [Phycisphaerae bacterium]
PAAYFEKTFLMDDKSGAFPLYPSGPMKVLTTGQTEPKPIASGKTLVLAPEEAARRVTIKTKNGELLLFDGRNIAQNGWFVVRTLIPANKTGNIIEWSLAANTIDNWLRPPMIGYSQLGYHPNQKKVAVIELDKNDTSLENARLLKIAADGKYIEVFKTDLKKWGKYLRYNYVTFDFSNVKDTGLYTIEYGKTRTKPFRIEKDIYRDAWHPTLDVYMPVQMDHMFVNEAYRVWHGAAHLDDALQAPVNHKHFDLYAQGPTTDTPYKPGEHIPGLNVGGWFDAGDFDIRTQTHYYTVISLVQIWETFRPARDETLIDQKKRYVDIHHPDGQADILQQIEHGTLQLLAQHKAVGHAISGIIVPDLSQYTHLGDALTMTDNLIYDPNLVGKEPNGFASGVFDDRWAFTSKSTPLNYGSIAALAAASRALRGYNDALAEDCLATAKKVWREEQSHEPDLFKHGNTSGGQLELEQFSAAVELLITTKDANYAEAVNKLLPAIEERFAFTAPLAVQAMPYMDKSYSEKLEAMVLKYKQQLDEDEKLNPFGVPITERGWAGSGFVARFGITNYLLHKAFPQIIGPEYTLRALDFLYGCHPGSNVSFVSGVGTVSKKIAYGNNRADFSFIAGGVVPGVLIIKPDFPENKEDWPFFWAENEYVIGMAPSYIYLVNAANDLLNSEPNAPADSNSLPEPVKLSTEQDHRKTMKMLGIKTLRPGRDGMNPKSPNYANYDESKANPYPDLPDALVLKNGQKVTTPQIWWNQRWAEIVEDFDSEIYGRVPNNVPKVNWEVISATNERNGDVNVITKKLVGHVDNSSYPLITVDIDLTLTTPADANGPVPVIMELAWGGPWANLPPRPGDGPDWKQQVLAKGWGYAQYIPTSVQADNGAGLTQGIIGLCNKGQPRSKPDEWGALRAWAWGASRALDYFETDKSVNAKRVGLEGHSRYGKAALIAMAYDPRFAIVFVSSSGEGGAKLHRRDWGEIVENLASSGEYHWMAPNFLKYAGPLNWNDLPIDSHELIALCAPRPVFISAGITNGDGWVDAKGMFMAAAAAGPVYKLLGKKDMGTTQFPPTGTTLIDGEIAYRQHHGGHTPGPNWPTFLKFAERYFKTPSAEPPQGETD